MISKTCHKCKIEKSIGEFYLHKGMNDGHINFCKTCVKKRIKIYYEINREKIRKYNKKWQQDNKSILKQYREKNKTKVKLWHYNEYMRNRQKYLNRAGKYYIENTEKVKSNNKKYMYKRLKTDKNFYILSILRRRFNNAIKGYKSKSTMQLLGCSIEYLRIYLENKFKDGMTWNNYGLHSWHIDHIIPCSKFDLCKEDEQKKCFHYTNLQPLWAKENLSKHTRIIYI